jgi:hypothetical protein
MSLIENLPQFFNGHVSIYLGGAQINVTEKFLYGSQIGPCIK